MSLTLSALHCNLQGTRVQLPTTHCGNSPGRCHTSGTSKPPPTLSLTHRCHEGRRHPAPSSPAPCQDQAKGSSSSAPCHPVGSICVAPRSRVFLYLAALASLPDLPTYAFQRAATSQPVGPPRPSRPSHARRSHQRPICRSCGWCWIWQAQVVAASRKRRSGTVDAEGLPGTFSFHDSATAVEMRNRLLPRLLA